jgi:hypothetical protein
MTVAPVRIRLSRAKGFNLQARSKSINGLAAINVAWPGSWGNPFIVGQDGTRAQCVHLHRMLLAGHIALTTKTSVEAQRVLVAHAARQWKTLKGKNVACWCPFDAACHGDAYLELANRVSCVPASVEA